MPESLLDFLNKREFKNFDTTSEDITKLKADVLVLRDSESYHSSVISRYVYKRSTCTDKQESVRAMERQRKKYHNGFPSQRPKTDFSSRFTEYEYRDMNYKFGIHAYIPSKKDFNSTYGISEYRNNIARMIIKILRYLSFELNAESVVFCFPLSDVDPNEYEDFKIVFSLIDHFVRYENPYLKVTFANTTFTNNRPLNSDNNKELLNCNSDENSRNLKKVIGEIKQKEFSKLQADLAQKADSAFSDINKYREYSSELKNKRQESNYNDQEFAKYIVSQYLYQYKGKLCKLAELIGCDSSEISRYRTGIHIPRNKERMLDLALAMELNQRDIYMFMNGAGFKYPEDFQDSVIELLHYSGEYDYHTIKSILAETCYDYKLLAKDEEKQL